MKAIMVMFDSLNRHFLPNYGCDWTKMPNFKRLGEKTLTFDNFYAGSMPCMPARRELHTGRYNFLHRSWTPIEPFDDSVINRLKKAGIYTHIATDHYHYWEDGGANYLTKYDTYEMIRGQEGDAWKGQVESPSIPETLSKRNDKNWRHDWVNRSFMKTQETMPQNGVYNSGIDFIERNHEQDNWLLTIESFDPHEPFYTQQNYKDLYPHDYHGKHIDWPNYGKNDLTKDETEHLRYEYAAVLSMCDNYLGKVLDVMDKYNLWEDTMLIVNTDHGFMLGEKECIGKNVVPFYNEVIHTPFFIYDPRSGLKNQRRNALAQTIDIVPTLAEYFKIDPPEFIDGKSLTPIIKKDEKIRDTALFGAHGGHVNITDGRYVYMHAPANSSNKPLYEYTLMPSHMDLPFKIAELQDTTLTDEFKFTKGCKVMRIGAEAKYNAFGFGTKLFDLQNDPQQEAPIRDNAIELRLLKSMREMMHHNEAPDDQYERLGIPKAGELKEALIENYYK